MSYVLAVLALIAVVLATSAIQHRLHLARLSRLRKAVSLTVSEYERGDWRVGSNLYISRKLTGWMKIEEMAAYIIMVQMDLHELNPLLIVEGGDDDRGPYLKLWSQLVPA